MPIQLASPGRTIHAGVILTLGTTEMLDVAPFEFFAWMNPIAAQEIGFPKELVADALDIKLHWVNATGELATTKSGALIQPTDTFETCPPLDIALMGASNVSYHLHPAEGAFIRKTFEHCSAFLTICGGVFALLQAGVLTDQTVTPPRMMMEAARKNAPNVNWVDKRWVRDGKLWTSNTLLNGTDLIRGFAEETWGKRNGMVEALLDAGHWPSRNVDFEDYHGGNIPAPMPS